MMESPWRQNSFLSQCGSILKVEAIGYINYVPHFQFQRNCLKTFSLLLCSLKFSLLGLLSDHGRTHP